MSDSRANMPIEDVLSSIRRLVSEEGKANRARTRPRPGGNGTRLVLTPSLRVADDDVTDTGSVLRLETPVNRPPFELTEDHSVAPATPPETRPARAERRRPRANGGTDTPWSDPNATLHEVARRSLEETGDPHSWDRFDFNHGPWTAFTETEAKDLEAEDADASPLKADRREAARPVPIRGEASEVRAEPASDRLTPPAPPSNEDVEPEEIRQWQADSAADAAAEAERQAASTDTDEDDTDDPGVFAAFESRRHRAPEPAARPEPESDDVGVAYQPVSPSPGESDQNGRAARLSAKIAALEAAIATAPGQWDPDRAGQDDYAGTPVKSLDWLDRSPADGETEDDPVEASEPEVAPDEAEIARLAEIAPDEEEALEDVSAAEADTGRLQDAGPEPEFDSEPEADLQAEAAHLPEPDAGAVIDTPREPEARRARPERAPFDLERFLASTPEPQADAKPVAAETELRTATEPDVPEVAPFVADAPERAEDEAAHASHLMRPAQEEDGSDVTILDEDMLRQIVTDMVRQELQGALGERITRNVRKLVRREIARALATRELE